MTRGLNKYLRSWSDSSINYQDFSFEYLHTFQNLCLQVWPGYILSHKASKSGVESERFEGFPDSMDFLRRKGNHVRV